MKQTTQLLVALLVMFASLARAADISWGNYPFGFTSDNNVFRYMFNSQGNFLDSSYSFELGTWNAGFTPNAANISSWAANWNVISSATAPDHWVTVDPTDPGLNDPGSNYEYFAQSVSLNPDGTVANGGSTIFTTGQQAYLWVFNSKAITASTEWAVVTDVSNGTNPGQTWQIPDLSGSLTQPLEWYLSDADTAVFGEVNGIVGAGSASVDPGPNSLQTFTPITLVPEPGSALLVLLAGVATRLRRRARGSLV